MTIQGELMDVLSGAKITGKKVTIFTTNREYYGKVLEVSHEGVVLVDPYITYRNDGQRYRCQDFYIPLAQIEAAGVLVMATK